MVKVCLYIIISFFIFSESRIFVIESYSSDYLWDVEYTKALKETIADGNELFFFEMNTKNLPEEIHESMAEQAYEKYLEINPDIVVLGDDAALKFLGPKLAYKGIPIVYLGINNNPRNYFKKLPPNIIGILERPIIKRSLVFLKELVPDSEKVMILFDTNLTSQIVKKEYFYNRNSMRIEGMDVDLFIVDTFSQWKNLVNKSRESYDFLILGLYQTIKDEDKKIVGSSEVAEWTSKNSPIPVFGFWDFSIGKNKAIGGYVFSGKKMGEKAGRIINRILAGESIKEIGQVFDGDGVFLFSRFQLQKWNLKLTDRMSDEVKYTD